MSPVTADLDAFSIELAPDLLDAVHAEVGAVHACDLDLQPLIAELPGGRQPRDGGVVRGRGDLQRRTDRLDSPSLAVLVDELHDLGGRGSSSRATKAEAAFRISLARRNSRFSRSSSAMRRCWSVGTPGRLPVSMAACLTQLRSDSGPMPSWRATRVTAPTRSPLSATTSCTIRTARSRSSAG